MEVNERSDSSFPSLLAIETMISLVWHLPSLILLSIPGDRLAQSSMEPGEQFFRRRDALYRA